ncbi:DUF2240 family protein [Candidatus Woesearchaeota archaeon]|nr:MAG: replication factor A1 [archaeon GW2011_AR4]MBS3130357.1 DUF2240 family protein [Candidatus Woesearchaeota archaeon]HIH37409.1 DUF2240 family protein [Candidatus Woesearchaeota archaeon]HIH49552.1 DUF2240 family protein [Candidatus Woesearchaeota archaeon]HIJ04192.1 DUF2240 family protein [Candidatus Woesearchaeota archaeon]
MISLPFEQVLATIQAKSGLSDEDLKGKIRQKMDQLSGLISKEGAAHIIANELGINLFEEYQGKVKLNKVLPGLREFEVTGKVMNKYDIRTFTRKDGGGGKVLNIVLGDDSGSLRVVGWGAQADVLSGANVGDILKISNAYTRDNQGTVEIHLNERASVTLNPPGVVINEVKSGAKPVITAQRKKIAELIPSESSAELLGTLVQIFSPNYFEVCPDCGKRARPKEDAFSCDTHGKVAPAYSYVMNAVLDDGTETIRLVFFRDQLENLLQKKNPEIIAYRKSPEEFEAVKNDLLGNIISVKGKVTHNEMFGRMEFVVNHVNPTPNPEEELKHMQG